MLSKLLQPSKKYAPNEVILEGSLTFFNLEQSAKTNAPNEVIHDKSMFVKLLQHKYLQPIITQYFIDNKSEIWLLFLIAHSKR